MLLIMFGNFTKVSINCHRTTASYASSLPSARLSRLPASRYITATLALYTSHPGLASRLSISPLSCLLL